MKYQQLLRKITNVSILTINIKFNFFVFVLTPKTLNDSEKTSQSNEKYVHFYLVHTSIMLGILYTTSM